MTALKVVDEAAPHPADIVLDAVFGTDRGYLALAFGVDGFHNDRGTYEFRSWSEVTYRWPAERGRMRREVEQAVAEDRSIDVYWCPALRRSDRRKGRDAIDGLCALWVDLDGPAADPALLDKLDGLTVTSGGHGHAHVYVLLAEPIRLDAHRRLNRALAAQLGGDHKWSDEALLRLPGTWNHKTDPAASVELLQGGGRVWPVDELAALLGVDLAAPEPGSLTAGAVDAEPAPDPLPHLVRRQLDKGRPTDRSAAVHAVVGACRSCGLTLGQAVTVAATYRPAVEKYGDRLADEVARSWEKVDPPSPQPGARVIGRIAPAAVDEDHHQDGDDQGDTLPVGLARYLLPNTVWESSTALRHIHRAAMARVDSPDAVLHAVLALVSSLVHHGTRVDTGVAPDPLNHFTIPVGESGAGKSKAMKTAADLLDAWITSTERFEVTGADGWFEGPPGSGEGLVEAFMGELKRDLKDEDGNPILDSRGNPRTEKIRAQVRHNAYFATGEGRQALIIAERKGSSLLPVLCSLWDGETAGMTNADAAKSRRVKGGSYVVGVVLGFQIATIDALFEDEAGGTPQRFIFAPASYAPHADNLDADDVDWPGDLRPDIPAGPFTITLTDEQRQEVRIAIRLGHRADSGRNPLDGHRMRLRCRVAALLALLHGHTAVDEDTWQLAATLVAHSCALRDWLADQGRRKAQQKHQAAQDRAVATATRTHTTVEQITRTQKAADVIVRAVDAAAGHTLTLGRARHAARRYRDVAADALALAAADGRLVVSDDGKSVSIPADES